MKTEYRSVNKSYNLPGKSHIYDEKPEYAKEKGAESSHLGEGPEGNKSEGRKPQGRQ